MIMHKRKIMCLMIVAHHQCVAFHSIICCYLQLLSLHTRLTCDYDFFACQVGGQSCP